jgi:hypothetical protein
MSAVRQLEISGVTAVRHLITNLYVASSSERSATVLGIVVFYGGLTYPSTRQSNPPMMVADLINECVLNKDNVWRIKSHTLRPVFMSSATPPSIEKVAGLILVPRLPKKIFISYDRRHFR